MQIQIEESLENYKIIKIIEFDSEKKMMSVVVRDQATGKTYSFCKGADTAIAQRLISEADKKQATVDSIKFAKKGYRTLAYAYKELDSHKTVYTEDEIENGLQLLAITGVEDKLQYNVVECIRDFREAKIRVFMLTGDKGETA